jgi:hypothetical protein
MPQSHLPYAKRIPPGLMAFALLVLALTGQGCAPAERQETEWLNVRETGPISLGQGRRLRLEVIPGLPPPYDAASTSEAESP